MNKDMYPDITKLELCIEGLCPIKEHPDYFLLKNMSGHFNSLSYKTKYRAAFIDEDLHVYAEQLKPHLHKTMTYQNWDNYSEELLTYIEVHARMTFQCFAYLVLDYNRRKIDFNPMEYSATAGINTYSSLATKVYLVATRVLSFYREIPVLEVLLAAPLTKKKNDLNQRKSLKDSLLGNEMAVKRLKKMQSAGLLDNEYQWINTGNCGQQIRITNYRKAVYAHYIGSKINLGRTWCSVFADLWPETTARQLSRALNEATHVDYTTELERVFL